MTINAESGLREEGGGVTEYFFAEFPPRGRDDSLTSRARPARTSATSSSRSLGNGWQRRHHGRVGRPPARSAIAFVSRRSRRGSSPSTASPTGRLPSARRRAQLMLPDTASLPSNDEIEAALTDHHALFGGDAHADALRKPARRRSAWMRRLAQWEPLLVGGVAAGWATEHSDVRTRARRRRSEGRRDRAGEPGSLTRRLPARADDPRRTAHRHAGAAIRLAILTPQQRRNRPRQSNELRLGVEALARLLASDNSAALRAPET